MEILLIEDNAGDVLLIQQALAGCGIAAKVHVALDGEQALLMLREARFQPSLIILDLNIPRIRGLDFLAQRPGHIPAVVFSSTSDANEKRRALELGASDFVSKPSDLDLFVKSVCGMVRKWVGEQASGMTAQV